MKLKKLVSMTLDDREQIRKVAIALLELERRRAAVRRKTPLVSFAFIVRLAVILVPRIVENRFQALSRRSETFLKGLKHRRRF